MTTGGSSVGERDLISAVLAQHGEVLVHGFAIRPGHPVAIGVVDGVLVIALPGYPVSAYVTARQLLEQAEAAAGGYGLQSIRTRKATLTDRIESEPASGRSPGCRMSRIVHRGVIHDRSPLGGSSRGSLGPRAEWSSTSPSEGSPQAN